MKRLIFLIAILSSSFMMKGQNDSLIYFSISEYFQIVNEFHPLAKQAKLQPQYGDAKVLKAQGKFDPKLGADVSQKYFDGTKYYSLIDGGVKIPTWYGIELKAGYEINDGTYLNNQNRTPAAGLMYAGISVPIGKGLIIDQRRYELKKAKIFRESTGMIQIMMLNDLFLDAGMIYWNWYQAFQVLEIQKNAVELAEIRLNGVRASALAGESAFIDTVEAGIQVQNRILDYQQAQLEYRNASQLLSIFLWTAEDEPIEITENIVPATNLGYDAMKVDSSYYEQLDTLIASHPELQKYDFKLAQLDIEKRYRIEQFKPELDINYNPVTEPINGSPFSAYTPSNYKWGLNFSFPIFLREERGELKLTNLEIQETELDRLNKSAELVYKAQMALNEWETTYLQIQQYRRTVNDTETLLKGERRLFESGESSLFMINSRELMFIKSQKKMIELFIKNRLAVIKTNHAFGLLPSINLIQ